MKKWDKLQAKILGIVLHRPSENARRFYNFSAHCA